MEIIVAGGGLYKQGIPDPLYEGVVYKFLMKRLRYINCRHPQCSLEIAVSIELEGGLYGKIGMPINL